MSLTTFDYVMMAIIAIVLPLYGLWEFRSMRRWTSDPRVKAYRLTMIIEIGLSFAVLGLWDVTSRRFSDLGLHHISGWGGWLGIGVALAACIFLIIQAFTILGRPESVANLRRQYGRLRKLVPRDDREERWWVVLSIVIGFCEELLYRGYLIVALAALLNMWMSVLLSSLVFGLLHFYQGKTGILKTGSFGLMMAGLFLLTGSLWGPILIHMAMDIASGYMGRRAFYLPGRVAANYQTEKEEEQG